MTKCKRKSIGTHFSSCVQPSFIIDITLLDPVIYSSYYYKLGEKIGVIGEPSKDIVD